MKSGKGKAGGDRAYPRPEMAMPEAVTGATTSEECPGTARNASDDSIAKADDAQPVELKAAATLQDKVQAIAQRFLGERQHGDILILEENGRTGRWMEVWITYKDGADSGPWNDVKRNIYEGIVQAGLDAGYDEDDVEVVLRSSQLGTATQL